MGLGSDVNPSPSPPATPPAQTVLLEERDHVIHTSSAAGHPDGSFRPLLSSGPSLTTSGSPATTV